MTAELAPLALGGVAHGLEVAVVEVLEPGEDGAAARGLGEHEVLDLDDARHRVLRVAEELEAHRAHVLWHAVHNPARAGDQPVAAFLLDAGQAAQELVGDVLAQAFLAEAGAGDVEPFGALEGLAAGIEVTQLEAGHRHVVDLAEVVVQPHDLEPLGVGRDHLPAGKVVQRRAPQHSLLAAGVHRDVAADARRLGAGRVDGENVAGTLGGVGHALRHHAGFAEDGGNRLCQAGQRDPLDLAHRVELLGVDHRALPCQRHSAAGVAGAAAARDDRQAELDAALNQRRHLGLAVGREHDERVLDPPVGGISDVRHTRHAVELDVVLAGHAAENPARALAQLTYVVKVRREALDGLPGSGQQLADVAVAQRVVVRAPLRNFGQAVTQRIDQQTAAAGAVEQVVLEVGVALHDPDVAQHLVQHACRAAGAALLAQQAQQFPGARAEQAQHDLAVRERGVVVGDLAQPHGVVHAGGVIGGRQGVGKAGGRQELRGVHRGS